MASRTTLTLIGETSETKVFDQRTTKVTQISDMGKYLEERDPLGSRTRSLIEEERCTLTTKMINGCQIRDKYNGPQGHQGLCLDIYWKHTVSDCSVIKSFIEPTKEVSDL